MIFAFVISSDALSQQSLQQFENMSQFQQALAAVDAIKQRKKITMCSSHRKQSAL